MRVKITEEEELRKKRKRRKANEFPGWDFIKWAIRPLLLRSEHPHIQLRIIHHNFPLYIVSRIVFSCMELLDDRTPEEIESETCLVSST